MTSPEWSSLVELYQRIVGNGVLQYLEKHSGRRSKRGIYSAPVVLWLMILQRLQGRGTLASGVQLLLQGAAKPLMTPCRRVRRKRISCRTGGYCQARQKLPQRLCRQVSQEIVERLREMLQPPGQVPVFVLDGSSLELEHSRPLVKHYPPPENQHGRSHWPVLRLVVLHDVETGMAQQPCWGPMYGPQAVSEQELAETAMGSLPPSSVVVGDRNFGVFSVAYTAQTRGLTVVLRLTDVRAKKLASDLCRSGQQDIVWEPSRWDRLHHAALPAEASVPGRLIAQRVGRGKSKQWLYLFTTSRLPAPEVVVLYGRRWNIETDLRSLKRTVQLHHIAAKSQDMMEKELLMAVSAYNLVRAVMCMTARRSRIDPRQLSFTQVLTVVDYAWHNLISAPTKKQHDKEFLRVLDLAAQCTLPQRSKHRSYPRLQWRRGGQNRFRKVEN
jgi:putative transposase